MIQKWLAFDIGTTGTKAALVDSKGQIERTAYREYPTQAAADGVKEQNAADWWQAVIETCHELNAEQEAEAIALTGQMQDVILVDSVGELTRPVILYSDTRARAEADEVIDKLTVKRLRELTGNDQDAGGLLAKLLWLRRHEPDALSQCKHLLLGAADYVAFQMTGRITTDTTTASTTGLMDIQTRKALVQTALVRLGLVGVLSLLPTMTPGGARIGSLTAHAAEILDLPAGLPVHHGPGDAGASTLGAGSGEIGTAYAYLGTSGWVAFSATDPAVPDSGAITLAHPHPERYIQVAPLLTAGGNLEWVRDVFGSDDYSQLIAAAMQCQPSKLLYLPYLNGERSPFRDPLARGAFIGLSGQTTKPDMYRAVLEGVVYAYRHALDSLMATTPTVLTLTGGGIRSLDWCQLFADITNVTVAVAQDAENVGVRGVVLAAQAATGDVADYASPDFPVATRLQPVSEHRDHFDRQYLLFRDVYPALKSTFARLRG